MAVRVLSVKRHIQSTRNLGWRQDRIVETINTCLFQKEQNYRGVNINHMPSINHIPSTLEAFDQQLVCWRCVYLHRITEAMVDTAIKVNIKKKFFFSMLTVTCRGGKKSQKHFILLKCRLWGTGSWFIFFFPSENTKNGYDWTAFLNTMGRISLSYEFPTHACLFKIMWLQRLLIFCPAPPWPPPSRSKIIRRWKGRNGCIL